MWHALYGAHKLKALNLQGKILIIRLSSLGDIVLATSILETFPQDLQADWIIKKEFASLLEGHPKIRKLWVYDSKSGFRGWLQLLRAINQERYTAVFDLHRSLRSRIASFLIRASTWKTISKQRVRTLGLFALKRCWPARLLPSRWIDRYRQMVESSSENAGGASRTVENRTAFETQPSPLESSLVKKGYWVLMPSSAWPTKEWPIENWLKLIREAQSQVVVLGTSKDKASVELVEKLKNLGISHTSGVGQWSLKETAKVISQAKCFVGVDTGLFHIAETMGVPALIVFGPTHPDSGFAPRLSESRAFGSSVWCRPCGKTGKFCHRITKRHICLKDEIENERILGEIRQELIRRMGIQT